MKRMFTVCLTLLVTACLAFADAGTYYSGINTSSTTFVTDLHNLIYPHTRISYDNYKSTIIPNYETQIDAEGLYVTCVYSGEPVHYIPPFAWTKLNREHTFCHSWMPTNPGESAPEYCDQHHLFPTLATVNSTRNNFPLGIVVTPTNVYRDGKLGKDAKNQTVYEPRNQQKGDAARAILYMTVCYDNKDGVRWFLNVTPQDEAVLKLWSAADPPDAWEIGRNDYIESIQHNRNPFVDHPEWVNMINFTTLTLSGGPVDPPLPAAEPSNHVTAFAAGTTTSATVPLTWTDAAAGTVPPTGYLIMANKTGVFTAPVDGTPVADQTDISGGSAAKNVTYASADAYTFAGMTASTTYYFAIYPYNGTGTSINYKTDGVVPSVSAATIAGSGGGTVGSFTAIYEFTGTSSGDGQFNTVTAQPTQGTFSPMTRTGVKWNAGANNYNSYSWGSGTARDDGKYVSFTVTMGVGAYFFNQSSTLVFDNMKSSTGASYGEVQYRYGSNALASAGTWTVPTTIATQTFTIPAPGNLTSNLLEIRLFGWSASATNGTMRFDNVRLTLPEDPLPVELTSFNVRTSGDRAELAWKTATETNNYGFEIERAYRPAQTRNAAGAPMWQQIGFVEGRGTTNAPQSYAYSDRPTAGTYAYRLKQIDRDGRFTYSAEVEVNTNAAPSAFLLGQNYPNPFNPATVISYQMPDRARVTLAVFDALGREVARLVDEEKGAGAYSVEWNASSAPSGMYFCRLTAGNFSAVKKMMLQK